MEGKISLTLILIVVNMLGTMGMFGAYYYTKKVFKRPAITEKTERDRIAQEQAKQSIADDGLGSTITFKSFTLNIKPKLYAPRNPGGESEDVKLSYATLGFDLVVKNASYVTEFETIRTQFMDELIQLMGKKSFEDLNTVQGRFILRNEILELANRTLSKPFVTNVFFSEFILQ